MLHRIGLPGPIGSSWAGSRSASTGMIQRGGEVAIRMLADLKQTTIGPLVRRTIAVGSTIYTDEYDIYARLKEWGYGHETVCHAAGEYARDDDGYGFCQVHVNTVEGFWSLLRSWLRLDLVTPESRRDQVGRSGGPGTHRRTTRRELSDWRANRYVYPIKACLSSILTDGILELYLTDRYHSPQISSMEALNDSSPHSGFSANTDMMMLADAGGGAVRQDLARAAGVCRTDRPAPSARGGSRREPSDFERTGDRPPILPG